MRRIFPLLPLLLMAAACYTPTSNQPVPAAIVNDTCRTSTSADSCAANAGCEWRAVKSACPGGAACPEGVCMTPDACASLTEQGLCEADTRCAWSGLRTASTEIALCPVGQSCAAGGYCHARDASGGGCTCVQPIVCPPDASCPAVACDCANGSTGGGGGTCTCACAACAPGETCPPCTCNCGGTRTTIAGSNSGSCGGGTGAGTCTCVCPTCAPGTTCPPCECACGAGNVGVTTTTTMVGPAPAETAPDPCAAHSDAAACGADRANSCSWIELGIVCITAPCSSGACVRVKPASDGGATGCGCACPACAAGQSCPPCVCDCCGRAADQPPVPVPVPPV